MISIGIGDCVRIFCVILFNIIFLKFVWLCEFIKIRFVLILLVI